MKKIPTLTDKELTKWSNILDKDIIYYLHYTGKIKLSNKQIEELAKADSLKDKTMYNVLKICKLIRKVKEDV